MHPKERTAWAWLICLLLVPAAYFGLADHWNMASLPPDLMRLLPLSVALLSMALVAGLVRLWNWRQSRSQGPEISDERDQLIDLKASAAAYHVLIAGMICVGFVMPFSASRWQIVDAAFLAVVFAEVVHYFLVLKSYRQGFHV